jgi:uncharacterized membrane-anchored protein
MFAKRWFLLAIGVQLLILFSLIGVHSFTQMTGEPVMLKTAPRDPWDPFRGEYVVLSYEISRLEVGTIPMEGEPYVRGQRVWVTLQEGNPYWTAVAVSDRRPQIIAGQRAVRGTVEWMHEGWGPEPAEPTDGSDPERPRESPQEMPGELFLRYGIEQFYVPQGEGPDLERAQAEMTVEALVDRFGRIALRKVYVDGKEIRWQ